MSKQATKFDPISALDDEFYSYTGGKDKEGECHGSGHLEYDDGSYLAGAWDHGVREGHFRLDSKSGIHIVRVASELDRETVRLYNLTVVAEDQGAPPRTSTAFLIIHVNDINDHSPVFSLDTYTAVLTESASIGSFVASPLALDEDTGVNSNIYYSIVQGKFSHNEKLYCESEANFFMIF